MMKENFDDTLFASDEEVEVGGDGVSGPAAEGSFSEDSATEDSSVEDDEQGMFEHFRLNVDVGQTPLRIDKYMACHLMDTSRHRVQCAIKNGYVRLGDKVAKANMIVRPGDVIRFVMPYERRGFEVLPEDIPLDIVYEDDDLLVVNKPAGLVVHPGCGNYTGTLVNALAWYLKEDPDFDVNDPSVGLVHRIDKNTSGLLVIAKTPNAKTKLGLQFFNKTTSRRYNALVWGDFDSNEGRIEGNIGRDPKDRLRMAVFEPGSDIGKHAVTHYKVLRRYGYTTLVECILESGRTHQIRAHMIHIGHPLFNDARYGGEQILRGTTESSYRQFINHCFELCPRQALHAKTLGFTHPESGQQMDFTSPWPTDMQALIDAWEQKTLQN